ncbi:O-Antigen Polymerase [Pseudarthrobacter phenanthrenivorans Sphe3]|uniref:O-Antigen Polymerase n=1 Tax=Pseudarthrobacter phenanthrenivorans (strain DSM 18606 / JCM 16027 / LMG 23796 / Sphe3) TaxID=930171 RepID=F0MA48_PSEPM|nr:O-antigen ligase family protein [Pseudarthrobacter phenanthrenivorans]ADX75035.1 O-Antigen Polymerase [Pseudarthrobacter phenanthrenivorans Sphe3]
MALEVRGRPQVPLIVRAMAFCIFFFPSSMVFKPIGAAGTAPMILALLVFGLWLSSVLFGLHDPLSVKHPGRLAVGVLFLATSASYVALYAGITGGSTELARASADRWMLLLLASAGVVIVVGEVIRTMDDAMVFLRALLAGASFCSLVAVVQFTLQLNPMEWFRVAMPGFDYNGGDTPFQSRGALLRVAGSTFHSIELAVVSAMLLPLSIWRVIYDQRGHLIGRVLGPALLIFAIASTVSRSGILGLLAGLVIFIPFLPSIPRLWALLGAPVALAALFLGVPGLVSTLTGTVTTSSSDPSITTRTNNFPRVEAMVSERPWLGLGPGNYVADTAIHILDNQYLNAAVTQGIIGLVAIIIYLTLPGVSTVMAARATADPQLRSLAGAVGAGALVAAVCSLTFDSMSFPVFALTYPVLVGLGGAVWVMVKREKTADSLNELGFLRPVPDTGPGQPLRGDIPWTR